MAASLAAAPSSVSSIPDLLAESSASAASCALLGAVEHPGPPRAAVAPPVRAAVAAPRPRGEPGAGPRQVRGRGLAVARARRGDVAVRRHLPGHGRGRPAELRGDLAGAAVAVEHPLDRVPLVPREPPVRPSGRLGSGHAGLPPSRAGGFRPLWGCLPGFAPQDSAQRVALSPEAVAMKMRIKGAVRYLVLNTR